MISLQAHTELLQLMLRNQVIRKPFTSVCDFAFHCLNIFDYYITSSTDWHVGLERQDDMKRQDAAYERHWLLSRRIRSHDAALSVQQVIDTITSRFCATMSRLLESITLPPVLQSGYSYGRRMQYSPSNVGIPYRYGTPASYRYSL